MDQGTRMLHGMYVYHEMTHRKNWSEHQWVRRETNDTIRGNSVIFLATVSIDLNNNYYEVMQ